MEPFTHPIKSFFSFPHKNWSKNCFIEEKLNPFEKRRLSNTQLISLISLGVAFGTLILFIAYSTSKFLPETYVEEVRIGGLTPEEAVAKISQHHSTPPDHILKITSEIENNSLLVEESSSSADLGAFYSYQEIAEDVFQQQQKNSLEWLKKLFFSPNSPTRYELHISYEEEKLKNFVAAFAEKFDVEPKYPTAALGQTGKPQTLSVFLGENVDYVDQEKTLNNIVESLNVESTYLTIKEKPESLVFTPVTYLESTALTTEQKQQALAAASKLVDKKITFTYQELNRTLNDQDMISFLRFPDGFYEEKIATTINEWRSKLDRPAQNAVFDFDKQNFVVTNFAPHREGLALDTNNVSSLIKNGIQELMTTNEDKKEINNELKFITTLPEKTLEKTNDLGIKERIGFGESYYAHSIPSRIHNVALTAKKVNLALVGPGKEFSFNKTIGDVSAQTGYQPAYVIKDGQTVLGDGGGVCQVSTTLFRSILDAGLEVTLRLPHSYRVSYYELDNKPGFDATVYAGNVDFRFINDTENYVLIYTETNSNDLYMKVELYGTSDGRTTEISDYKSWDYRDPLPTEYVPDPSLPPGKLKQIDWSASGIKAQFVHTIKDKNGETIRQKTYYSNYKPWSAKYLQGV